MVHTGSFSGFLSKYFFMKEIHGSKMLLILPFLFALLPVSLFAQEVDNNIRSVQKDSGYVNFTGQDMLPGDEGTSFRIQMINGYQFNPHFAAGIGLGYTSYNEPLDAVSLFLDMRAKFLKAKATPFVFMKAGYSFSVLHDEELPVEDHKGGFLFNPGIGLQFTSYEGLGWYFNAGYNMDHLSYEEERWDGRILETKLNYRRIMLGLGFSF